MRTGVGLLPAALLFLVTGCAGLLQDPPAAGQRVHHIVLCWLKEPGDRTQRQELMEQTRRLREIPGVREIRVGESIPSDRPIVDDSFDVGIVMTFDNVADMNRYLRHPQHRWALQEKILPLTRRILVYDFQ